MGDGEWNAMGWKRGIAYTRGLMVSVLQTAVQLQDSEIDNRYEMSGSCPGYLYRYRGCRETAF